MMTLAQGLTQVRSLIDEPVENFWKDTEIKSWINAGQDALCSDMGLEYVQSITLNGSISYTLTTPMKNIWQVEITGTGVHSKLLPGRDFIFYGGIIKFMTSEYTSGTMDVYGTKAPTPLVLDTDVFSVDDEYAWGAIYFAAAHCVRKNEAFSEDNINMVLYRDIKGRREQSMVINIQSMTGPMHYYDRMRSAPPVTGAGSSGGKTK